MTLEPDNGKLPMISEKHKPKKGSCLPKVNLPEEVSDDLRRFIFDLIDKKTWAGRSDREIAQDIINADDYKGRPRFYTLSDPDDYFSERERLSLSAVRQLLKTYRHRTLEVFKEDLVPYLQEAIVEVIKTAGQKPQNLKMILDALGVGKETKDAKPEEPDTPSPAYLKYIENEGAVRKRLAANVPERTSGVVAGLRAFGYEGPMRDDFIKRRRPVAGVVPGRDDTGMDGPPNIIEVDGGPYAFAALPSQDDILDYGREYMGDTDESEYSDTDELGSVEADESGDGED